MPRLMGGFRRWRPARPAGSARPPDRWWTQTSELFTGEVTFRKVPPPELKDQMDAMGALEVGEPTFLDLKHPLLHSSH